MSSEWSKTTLGHICEMQNGSVQTGPFGSQLHTSDYKEIGVPVVMPTNIGDGGVSANGIARIDQSDVERLSQHKLMLNDIVFSRRGDVTKNALVREQEIGWLCGTGCLKVRLGNESIANAKFISYYLRTPETKDWLVRHAVGATMPNLNTTILSAVPIHLPSFPVQLSIASMLGTLDDRILLLRETNKTLEAIAQALFKSWFIDFDPVRAKMEGRQPEGMDEATAALFPDSFEESELEEIPRGWLTGKLSNVATLKGGKMLDKSSFSEAGANPVFGGAGVMGYTDLSNADGFVITVGRVGAYCGQYFWHQGNAWVNNNASLVSPIKPSHAQWLYLWLKNVDMELIKKGAAQPFVSNGDISELKIALPPADVIEKFTEYGTLIFERIAQNSIQTKSLITLRDILLPRLISGQLRLPEAEAEVKALTA